MEGLIMPLISGDEIQLMHNYICQSVNDPKRIQILYALHDQPLHVTALAESCSTCRSRPSRAISRSCASACW